MANNKYSSYEDVSTAQTNLGTSVNGMDYYRSHRGGNVDDEISVLKSHWTTESGMEVVKTLESISEEMNTAMDSIQSAVDSMKTSCSDIVIKYTKTYI